MPNSNLREQSPAPEAGWLDGYRERIMRENRKSADVTPISIKLSMASGCFCKLCAPEALRIVERYRRSNEPELVGSEFVEHENGPELLTCMHSSANGSMISEAVVKWAVSVLDARAKGLMRGDKAKSPFDVSIRRYDEQGHYVEQAIFHGSWEGVPDPRLLGEALTKYPATPR